ncbi:hypothetical protein NEDG_01196 [Nematocida displodere]|uniref:Uncharacterized protein n=1 Tax=Nematocida displodere TaxID=1805483 RepID=A0A177EAU4_9MICR|nr:hypothetical protein NEDG_01196 [Nematocida displodere]
MYRTHHTGESSSQCDSDNCQAYNYTQGVSATDELAARGENHFEFDINVFESFWYYVPVKIFLMLKNVVVLATILLSLYKDMAYTSFLTLGSQGIFVIYLTVLLVEGARSLPQVIRERKTRNPESLMNVGYIAPLLFIFFLAIIFGQVILAQYSTLTFGNSVFGAIAGEGGWLGSWAFPMHSSTLFPEKWLLVYEWVVYGITILCLSVFLLKKLVFAKSKDLGALSVIMASIITMLGQYMFFHSFFREIYDITRITSLSVSGAVSPMFLGHAIWKNIALMCMTIHMLIRECGSRSMIKEVATPESLGQEEVSTEAPASKRMTHYLKRVLMVIVGLAIALAVQIGLYIFIVSSMRNSEFKALPPVSSSKVGEGSLGTNHTTPVLAGGFGSIFGFRFGSKSPNTGPRNATALEPNTQSATTTTTTTTTTLPTMPRSAQIIEDSSLRTGKSGQYNSALASSGSNSRKSNTDGFGLGGSEAGSVGAGPGMFGFDKTGSNSNSSGTSSNSNDIRVSSGSNSSGSQVAAQVQAPKPTRTTTQPTTTKPTTKPTATKPKPKPTTKPVQYVQMWVTQTYWRCNWVCYCLCSYVCGWVTSLVPVMQEV